MKLLNLLPVASLGGAFILPDPRDFNDAPIEANDVHSLLDSAKSIFDDAKDAFQDVISTPRNGLDEALHHLAEGVDTADEKIYSRRFDVDSWLSGSFLNGGDLPPLERDRPRPPHKKPPHPHPHPHPPHHSKPNQTVYELIASSKYTTKLAALINEYEDLVKLLNGTEANYTVFAPTDAAFAKIPKNAPKPGKECIKKILTYHVADSFYPAGRVFHSHTIPTLYEVDTLGKESLPQRLAVSVGLKGLTVNYYSRIVAIDIFGSNGVIHGIDSILVPPPKILDIISFLPTEFSTLELGLDKTGLDKTLKELPHAGATFFAPPNVAFKKLGPRINAFLFSKYGTKYLKALLEYHVVVNQTLYSDAYYDGTKEAMEGHDAGKGRGYYHFDFPTLLDDRNLSVDVTRFGPFIGIKVNGFAHVVNQDGIARDGVIQVVSDVLIPPKKPFGEASFWDGEEMDLEDFKERLEPYVKDDVWKDL